MRQLVNNEYEKMQKETVVAQFKSLSRHLVELSTNTKIPVRQASRRVEILTWGLLNTMQECLSLNCNIRFKCYWL
jgi:hypothetical protein